MTDLSPELRIIIQNYMGTLARSSGEVRKALHLRNHALSPDRQFGGDFRTMMEGADLVVREARKCAAAGKLFDLSLLLDDRHPEIYDLAEAAYEEGVLNPPFERTVVALTLEPSAGLRLGACLVFIREWVVGFTVRTEGDQADWTPAFMANAQDRVNWRMEPDDAPASIRKVCLAALLLICDQRLLLERVEAPPKLNKARQKAGKTPYGDYWHVSQRAALDYTTRLSPHSAGSHGPGDGTRASPIAHLRRGHQRHLASGKVVWVREARIGELVRHLRHRDHYEIKGPDHDHSS